MRRTQRYRPDSLDHPLESRELLSTVGARLAEVRAERAEIRAEAVEARAARGSERLLIGQTTANPAATPTGTTSNVGGLNGIGLTSGLGLNGGTPASGSTASATAASQAAAIAAAQEEVLIAELALLNTPSDSPPVTPLSASGFGFLPVNTTALGTSASTLSAGVLSGLSLTSGLSLIGSSTSSSTLASTTSSLLTNASFFGSSTSSSTPFGNLGLTSGQTTTSLLTPVGMTTTGTTGTTTTGSTTVPGLPGITTI